MTGSSRLRSAFGVVVIIAIIVVPRCLSVSVRLADFVFLPTKPKNTARRTLGPVRSAPDNASSTKPRRESACCNLSCFP